MSRWTWSLPYIFALVAISSCFWKLVIFYKIITNTSCILCVRNYSVYFIYTDELVLTKNYAQLALFFSFYRWGNWGSELLNELKFLEYQPSLSIFTLSQIVMTPMGGPVLFEVPSSFALSFHFHLWTWPLLFCEMVPSFLVQKRSSVM